MWQSKKANWNGVETSYFQNGEGHFDYLLLHGFLETANMWQSTVTGLSSKIDFLAPDLPGHGNSEMLSCNAEIEAVVEWLHPVLEENGRPVFVIAHSLGGYIALELADSLPEFVSGIFLVHSTASPDSDKRKASRDLGMKVLKADRKRYLKIAIEGLFLDNRKDSLRNEIQSMVEEAISMDDEAILWYLEAMKFRKSHVSSIANRLFPLIYLYGNSDPLLPADLYRKEIAVTLPEKTFHTMAAGHMAHLEAPEELMSAIEWTVEHFGRKI